MRQIKFLILLLVITVNPLNKVFAQKLDKKIDKIIETEFKDINGPGGVFMVAIKPQSLSRLRARILEKSKV